MHLCQAIASVLWDLQTTATFAWPCATSGVYTARSVYQRLCQGLKRSPFAASIWRNWAPLKCKSLCGLQHNIVSVTHIAVPTMARKTRLRLVILACMRTASNISWCNVSIPGRPGTTALTSFALMCNALRCKTRSTPGGFALEQISARQKTAALTPLSLLQHDPSGSK